MPTRYLSILSVQEPFCIGLDGNNRTLMSCNYNCVAAYPVAKFEEEVGRLLFDAGLLVFNTNGFIGPDTKIPDGPGPYTSLIDTGGVAPIETHNGDKYQQRSLQIIVRALGYQAARARAREIWDELDGTRNVVVTAA